MQFNLVNDQEQVAQFVWRGVAWRCMALALEFISILGREGACCVCSVCVYYFLGVLFRGGFGQF